MLALKQPGDSLRSAREGDARPRNATKGAERPSKDHPHTLWIISDIVRCLHDLDRLDDAIILQQEVVDRSDSILGSQNPDTLWAMNSLRLLFETVGNVTMVVNVQETAYKGQIGILGGNHLHCVWTRDVLLKLQVEET
ncbi:MAG: hypothetical protein L6R36_006352 [Xanthoria steineri]|nr:MAG: hypothetical protein L6R36_006352 [Xanthoria steineri]